MDMDAAVVVVEMDAPVCRAAGVGVDFPCEKIAPALSASLSLAALGIRARSASESLPLHGTPGHLRYVNKGQHVVRPPTGKNNNRKGVKCLFLSFTASSFPGRRKLEKGT